MSHPTPAAKSPKGQKDQTSTAPAAGPRGIAIRPPDYGIAFIDGVADGEGPLQLMPRPDRRREEQEIPPFLSRGLPPSAPNHTGLPDDLKAGIESISGFDMSDVRVHYDSSEPAALQALAYTQGTDIHVAPGQERHLPHEAWHVVQQKQGRVKPRFQLKGERINDDQGLEHEAEVMGENAVRRSSLHSPSWFFRELIGSEETHTRVLSSAAASAGCIQRLVIVAGSDGTADLRKLLEFHNLRRDKDLKSWFRASIAPRLVGQFGFQRFWGYLNSDKEEYSLSVAVPKKVTELTFEELNSVVCQAINVRLMQTMVEKGHSSIGKVELLKRENFSSAIKESFSKAPVIRELATQIGQTYENRQIHLRHFVMGSWFRALPNVIEKANLGVHEAQEIGKHVATLIPRVGRFAGKEGAAAGSTLVEDVQVLSALLHDLVPNLNAGAGPENTIIGFVSNGLSNFAEDIRTQGLSIAADDAGDLIEAAIDGVSLVSLEERERFKTEVQPVKIFEGLLSIKVGDADPIPPNELSMVIHDFAFQLGMDFMKHQVGAPKQFAGFGLADLQGSLLPLGQFLYGLILTAQINQPSSMDIMKFLNAVDSAISGFEAKLSK